MSLLVFGPKYSTGSELIHMADMSFNSQSTLVHIALTPNNEKNVNICTINQQLKLYGFIDTN